MATQWDDPAVVAQVEAIERECGCTLCVAAVNLTIGRDFRFRADRKCKTASTIKLPMLAHLAIAIAKGAYAWTDTLVLTDAEKVGGSGILTQLSAGLRLTLRDICILMTVVSDNTATNMLIEHCGVDPVNARMRSLGLPLTTLYRKSYSPDTEASREFGLGMTTPEEMAQLLKLLAEERVGGPSVSADVLGILGGQCLRDSIPRGLPANWTYAGKTGGVDGVRNDVGLVTSPDGRKVALAIFCQALQDTRWSPENAGLVAIGSVVRTLISSD